MWEVRNTKQHFVYSKIMLWVSFDRGPRLADKRNLPCPNSRKWLKARDNLYEEIMDKGKSNALPKTLKSHIFCSTVLTAVLNNIGIWRFRSKS